MLKHIFLFCLVITLGVGCKKNNQNTTKKESKPEMSIVVNHSGLSDLEEYTKMQLKDWKTYEDVVEFLQRFTSVSPQEALDYAVELKELITKLKADITYKELKTAAFRARINVLENETLRLYDMRGIKAITSKEINTQVDKIFTVFSSVNDKINAVYNQKRLDKNINSSNFFSLDTIKK